MKEFNIKGRFHLTKKNWEVGETSKLVPSDAIIREFVEESFNAWLNDLNEHGCVFVSDDLSGVDIFCTDLEEYPVITLTWESIFYSYLSPHGTYEKEGYKKLADILRVIADRIENSSK